MDKNLHFYRIMPGVVRVGKKTKVTISALDTERRFSSDVKYRILILPSTRNQRGVTKVPDRTIYVKGKDGKLTFEYFYEKEEEYFISIFVGDEKTKMMQLSVYAVEDDLYALRPLKGDQHCHSCPSDVTLLRKKDGASTPPVIPAYYRSEGFDYMTLTDHERFFGSVEMNKFYSDVKLGLTMNFGEEVHAPKNYVHIVNFGGEYSVNEIFQNDPERFEREVKEIMDTEDITYFDKELYAINIWVARNIRKAKGLAVFCHPHWNPYVYNVSDEMTKLFMESGEFDAYEVVGATTFGQNNLKLALYDSLKDEGIKMPPMLGSSDCHSFTIPNATFLRRYTITYAKENKTKSIIEAIKDYKCTPVEWVGSEYIVHGSYRLVSYTRYLMEWYFPLTKQICEEEGNLMRQYVLGIEGAKEALEERANNVENFWKKFSGRK